MRILCPAQPGSLLPRLCWLLPRLGWQAEIGLSHRTSSVFSGHGGDPGWDSCRTHLSSCRTHPCSGRTHPSSQHRRGSSDPGCAGHRILIIPPLRDIKTANSPAGARWSNSCSSCRTHPASAGQRIMNIAFWRHLCEVSKVKRVCLRRPARFMTHILAPLAKLMLPLQGRGL